MLNRFNDRRLFVGSFFLSVLPPTLGTPLVVIVNLTKFTSLIVINLICIIFIGVSGNCVLGPFQAIPYTPNEPATKFTDQQQPNRALTSCSLWKALLKFPDNVTEMELQWLDESYVNLTVLNKELHFKVSTHSMTGFS